MQQINLYRLLPKPKATLLSQKKVIIYYSLFAILLFIFYMYNVSVKHKLENALTVATNDVAVVQNESIQLAQKYPVSNSEELQKSIKESQIDWDNRAGALELLTPNANFSAYLTGLADATTPGVWYTDIIFQRGINNINLKGAALQATLLTNLMEKLQKPIVFNMFSFTLKEVHEEKLPATFNVISERASQS